MCLQVLELSHHLSLTSPFLGTFTWPTPPGPYRATTCRERELTLDHIHTFLTTDVHRGPPGWGISSISGPPPRQHKHERRYTPFTHTFFLTRWIWKDDITSKWYSGTFVGLKLTGIRLIGEEKPRKNLTQETCSDRGSNSGPLRDSRACYCLLHSGGL